MKKLILGLLALMLILGFSGCEDKEKLKKAKIEHQIDMIISNIENTISTNNLYYNTWKTKRDACINMKNSRYISTYEYDKLLSTCDSEGESLALLASGITVDDNAKKQTKYIDDLIFLIKKNQNLFKYAKRKLTPIINNGELFSYKNFRNNEKINNFFKYY